MTTNQDTSPKQQKIFYIFGRLVVEPRGIEPLTFALRTRRSPS